MKSKYFLFIMLGTALLYNACSLPKKVVNDPEESIVLQMHNQIDGTNGSGVAYNPNLELYYTVIAGNVDFPLEVFNVNGEFLHSASAGVDCRGMWYNKSTKTLEANAYQGGLYKIVLSKDGIPTGDIGTIFEGGEQPYSNSCAEFDAKNGELLFYYSGSVYRCSRKNGTIIKKIELDFPGNLENFNTTSLIYTGYKGLEVGILDCSLWKIYLFDLSNGIYKETINIPDRVPVDCAFMFDFANDYAFFYDVNDRSWTGIKIFK